MHLTAHIHTKMHLEVISVMWHLSQYFSAELQNTHLCTHKHMPTLYYLLQILLEAPWAALPAEWKPISEPFWRREWESTFYKVLSKSTADSELPAVHWVSLTGWHHRSCLNHRYQLSIPSSHLWLSQMFGHFPLLSFGSTGGWREVRGSPTRAWGWKRDGGKVLEE